MEAEPQRIVGERYRLVEALGVGGMGVVWRAHDELLDRDVAVKEIRLTSMLNDDERDQLVARSKREARTAAQLDDVHVVRVYDVVEEDGRPWIVMELVEGTSLGQRVRAEGPLPSPVVAQIGLAVLHALTAAHAAGILHRDVKPSNVVLATDGRPVLTDFGAATAVGEMTLTATGMLIGSPAYLPPERARGESGDARSDLWSLGALLYTAVEGRAPFERGTALATLTAAIDEPHDPPVHAGRELGAAIDGLLAKDPADRLDHAAVEALLRAASAEVDLRPLAARDAEQTVTPPGERTQAVPPAISAIPRRGGGPRLVLGLGVVAAILTGAVMAILQLPGLDQPADAAGDLSASQTGSGSPSQPVATTQASASLPAGFRLHQDETGFSVAVPMDWTEVRDGSLVDFRDPQGGRFLRIDQTDEPKPDPLADWQAQEPAVADRLPNYERIRLESVEYRDWLSADWEFTFGDSGTTRVLNRNLVTGPKAYAIYWSVDADRWEESRPLLEVIAQSFQPAPG